MGGRGGSPNPGPGAPVAPAAGDITLQTIQRAISDTGNKQVTTLELVRERLSAQGMGREQQDTELLRLARARQITLVPISKQSSMSQGERDAEIMFGNQRKGAVMMG